MRPRLALPGIRRLPDNNLRFDIRQVAHACNAFYKSILDDENRLMRERGYSDAAWDKSVQELLAAARDKMQEGRAFLLRVGRHSGAESVTVHGARNGNIKIMKGNGQPPEYADAAKTLWLAADEKGQTANLLPFGWLLVEVQPMDLPCQEWGELQALCEPHLAPARAFAARLAGKQAEMEKARALAESKRREEEEQARQRAEAEARAAREEAERQARLAAMTPNLQRIEEFIAYGSQRVEQLRGGKERLNADFHNRARKLAQEALEGTDWTAEEKRAVANAIAEWLPRVVEKIDKDQLKKLKLSSLRNNT